MSSARTIFVNSAWMVGAEVMTRTATLATILYLSRTLAPDSVGVVEFGVAVFGFLYLVTMNGVEAGLVPALVRQPTATGLAGRSVVLGWTQLGIVQAGFLTTIWWLGVSWDLWTAALVFGAAAAFAPLSLRFTFIAGERMWPIGIGHVAGGLTLLAATVAIVHGSDQALRVGGCWVLAMVVRGAIPLSIYVWRHGAPQADLRGFGPDLVRTAGLGAGGVARGLMVGIDVIVLGILTEPATVGCYGLAAKVPLFLATLTGMLHTALFPSVVRAFASGATERVEQMVRGVLHMLLGFALPSVACFGAVAGSIVTVLFTDRFADAGPIMAALLWRVPLLTVGGLFRTLVWAQSPAQDARVAGQVLLATAVILASATASFGAGGAVAGMLCGDLIGVVLYARRAGIRLVERPFVPVRALGASALAAVTLVAVPVEPGPTRIAVALGVWTIAVAFAVWPRLGTLRRLLDDG